MLSVLTQAAADYIGSGLAAGGAAIGADRAGRCPVANGYLRGAGGGGQTVDPGPPAPG